MNHVFDKLLTHLVVIIWLYCMMYVCHVCRNLTFGRVWGWHSHSQNGDLGVFRDSRNFRVRSQGSKHLALRRVYIIGKLSKCRCRKWVHMSHLDIYSTWKKERPEVKLPIWLPTITSRESTWPQFMQVECDTPLENSRRELQVCLDLIPKSYAFAKLRESKRR
jgi:hypothetical protein